MCNHEIIWIISCLTSVTLKDNSLVLITFSKKEKAFTFVNAFSFLNQLVVSKLFWHSLLFSIPYHH